MGDADLRHRVLDAPDIQEWVDENLDQVDEDLNSLYALHDEMDLESQMREYQILKQFVWAMNYFIIPVVLAIGLCYSTQNVNLSGSNEATLQCVVLCLMYLSNVIGLPLYVISLWDMFRGCSVSRPASEKWPTNDSEGGDIDDNAPVSEEDDGYLNSNASDTSTLSNVSGERSSNDLRRRICRRLQEIDLEISALNMLEEDCKLTVKKSTEANAPEESHKNSELGSSSGSNLKESQTEKTADLSSDTSEMETMTEESFQEPNIVDINMEHEFNETSNEKTNAYLTENKPSETVMVSEPSGHQIPSETDALSTKISPEIMEDFSILLSQLYLTTDTDSAQVTEYPKLTCELSLVGTHLESMEGHLLLAGSVSEPIAGVSLLSSDISMLSTESSVPVSEAAEVNSETYPPAQDSDVELTNGVNLTYDLPSCTDDDLD